MSEIDPCLKKAEVQCTATFAPLRAASLCSEPFDRKRRHLEALPTLQVAHCRCICCICCLSWCLTSLSHASRATDWQVSELLGCSPAWHASACHDPLETKPLFHVEDVTASPLTYHGSISQSTSAWDLMNPNF